MATLETVGRKFEVHSFDEKLGEMGSQIAEIIGHCCGPDGGEDILIIDYENKDWEVSLPFSSFVKSIIKEI